MLELLGSSWRHERGHAPMVATAAEWERLTGGAVRIRWEPRSLKDFGVAPVEELARQYDLVVIDHPHIGAIARAGSAVPLEELADAAELAGLAECSPGRSQQSYHYAGRQWALAVDAACQVSAWRPDLLAEPPTSWDGVLELSQAGRVLWPLCDVDAAASMLTLLAGLGHPLTFTPGDAVDPAAAAQALELMRAVAAASDPRCLTANPIATLDALSGSDDFWYAPLTFGYLNYSRPGHPGRRVAFGDIPSFSPGEPAGSLLGGAGLMVSAYRAHRTEAAAYALHVAAAATQRTTYLAAGGQPAHDAAWSDPASDAAAGGFFSGTAATMAGAWTRPRGPGFTDFQNEMIDMFGHHRHWLAEPGSFLRDLCTLYDRHIASGS